MLIKLLNAANGLSSNHTIDKAIADQSIDYFNAVLVNTVHHYLFGQFNAIHVDSSSSHCYSFGDAVIDTVNNLSFCVLIVISLTSL